MSPPPPQKKTRIQARSQVFNLHAEKRLGLVYVKAESAFSITMTIFAPPPGPPSFSVLGIETL